MKSMTYGNLVALDIIVSNLRQWLKLLSHHCAPFSFSAPSPSEVITSIIFFTAILTDQCGREAGKGKRGQNSAINFCPRNCYVPKRGLHSMA